VSVFIFLHIAVMFSAIAVAQGPLILLVAAVRRRDVPGIRGLLRAQFPLARWIPAVFGVGVVLGVIAVFTNGFDPLRPWLLIAYILTAIAAVLPRFSAGAWSQRLGMAAATSPDDAPSPELAAVMDDPRARSMLWLDFGVVVLLIADMVIKPLS
jgi:hypothetical protein